MRWFKDRSIMPSHTAVQGCESMNWSGGEAEEDEVEILSFWQIFDHRRSPRSVSSMRLRFNSAFVTLGSNSDESWAPVGLKEALHVCHFQRTLSDTRQKRERKRQKRERKRERRAQPPVSLTNTLTCELITNNQNSHFDENQVRWKQNRTRIYQDKV